MEAGSNMMKKTRKKRKPRKQYQGPQVRGAIGEQVRDVPLEVALPDPFQRRAYGEMAAMDSAFKILYIIPHVPQELDQASIFGWYTPALHEAAGPIISAAALPADIREPFTSIERVLFFRLTRRIWPRVMPVQLDALTTIPNHQMPPFRVFITTDRIVADAVDAYIAKARWPCLHVSLHKRQGRVHPRKFGVKVLLQYCRHTLDILSAKAEWVDFARTAKSLMQMDGLRHPVLHPLARGLHNLTLPNEVALTAFGHTLSYIDRISVPLSPHGIDSQRYVDRICLSADAVESERSNLIERLESNLADYRYIVAVQSAYWRHFRNWRDRHSSAPQEHKEVVRMIYAAVAQGTTYADLISPAQATLLSSPLFRVAMAERAADAKSFTAGLTILAAASLAPVLRLEPKLNQIRGDLKQLAHCVRAHAIHNFEVKQSRLANRLSIRMRTLIDQSYLDRIDRAEKGHIEGLKLVSDLPLELMSSGDMPLSMRFNVSRVLVLPGNLYLGTCLLPPVIVPIRALKDILVVRSFEPEDPLRNILEISVSALRDRLQALEIEVRFVDVSSEDEFVAALSDFDGALMIFDGHGDYDGESGEGAIVVGGSKIDAWQLRARCRVPPIVIFSACDTQPLDGSHSSSATAAFALGAYTVLGTTLPIDGRAAGIFIGRLMLRIAEFIPLAIKHLPFLSWRDVISGMLRMTHVTETMRALHRYAGRAYREINFDTAQMRANIAINQNQASWYSDFLDELAAQTEQPVDLVKRDIARFAALTDSMKYVQLGNPENIRIVEEDAVESYQREARATG